MYHLWDPRKIQPTGWLKKQLRIQADSLSGNLQKIWSDIKESAWIGGDKEGWERVPYWLDGFIPMAWLLDDEALKADAKRYIDAIISRQQKDGWLCPCKEEEREKYDTWAYLLIGKVLALYCEFTHDRKVYSALRRGMKCFADLLLSGKIHLFFWGQARWFEGLIALQYLYEAKKEDWIINCAKELKKQGTKWDEQVEKWKVPEHRWTYETHIVNIGMLLKYDAVYSHLTGEPYERKDEELWSILDKYNGTAVGTFTGDECLAGISNVQGTELCAVVEQMYSCELMYAITKKPIWAERLERLAFNALPATISDDMWTHQYDQLVNQISCTPLNDPPIFTTNCTSAHLFGLEPNYGCCTANFNQGWPKLAMSIFSRVRGGILCAIMLPAKIEWKYKKANVTLETVTDYPFRHSCDYVVITGQSVEFALKIRIPRFAKAVKIDGKPVKKSDYIIVRRVWDKTTTVKVELEAEPVMFTRPHNLKCAQYGPLVFSLPLSDKWEKEPGDKREAPMCNYILTTEDEWRFGFAAKTLKEEFRPMPDIPFSSKEPAVVLKSVMAPVKWNHADGFDNISAPVPASRTASGDNVEKELYPYGCAKLRMTEMPLLKAKK